MASVSDRPPEVAKPGMIEAALLAAIDAARARGISLNALSGRADLNDGCIRALVNGTRRKIYLGSVNLMVDALGLALFRKDGTPVPGSFSEGLRAEAGARRLSLNALSRATGVYRRSLTEFLRGDGGLELPTVEKLAAFLELRLALRAEAADLMPVPRAPANPPPSYAELRAAIVAGGLTDSGLARRSGVPRQTIGRFRREVLVIKEATALRLARAIGITMEPAKILARPDAPPPSPAGPISTPPCPATIEGRSREPIPWRGTREQLDRELAEIHSYAQRESIRTLAEASLQSPPLRLSKRQLADRSNLADAANHIRDVAATGCRLGRAIDFAGRGSRRGMGMSISVVK